MEDVFEYQEENRLDLVLNTDSEKLKNQVEFGRIEHENDNEQIQRTENKQPKNKNKQNDTAKQEEHMLTPENLQSDV